MAIDILIFAAIAVFLVLRLNGVLGTKRGDERQRPNPFAEKPEEPKPLKSPANANGTVIEQTAASIAPAPQFALTDLASFIHLGSDGGARIREGLEDIASADIYFDVASFIGGARYAFEMVVTAYARGDLATLKPLLSAKLFGDFSSGVQSRMAAGHTSEITIHRIKQARIIDARLGGTMAYITVDFDVEETAVTRDSSGNIIDGHPDRIFSVEDIWTFTRDTRSTDPNWTLIETRAADTAAST